MKKLFIIASLTLASASFAKSTIGVESLAYSGLLKVGTKIGNCEVITSNLLRAYESGPVSGLQIKVQSGNKIVMAILDSRITATDNNSNRSEIIESFVESTTGGNNSLSAYFEKRTSQYVKIEDKGISPGKGVIINLLIETKQSSMIGNMKVVQDKSINCH